MQPFQANTAPKIGSTDLDDAHEFQLASNQKRRKHHPSLQRVYLVPLTPHVEQQTQAEDRQAVISTAGSAAIAGIGELIAAVLRYVTNVVMTNLVSQSIFGIYATVYTAATTIGTIALFGLDTTIVRFLSAYHAKDEKGAAAGLIRFVLWMTLISGIIAGVLFYLSATVIAHLIYHQDAYMLPLKEGALLIPSFGLQLIVASGLTALKAIKWKVSVDRLLQPGLSLLLLGVFYVLGLRLEALMLATICGYLVSGIVGLLLLRRASKLLIGNAAPTFALKTWLRFALPMFFNSSIHNILNSTDVLFLAAFGTAAQVGLYAAADRASILVVMPYFALNIIFPPLIAGYYATGAHEQLASLAKLVTKWSFSLSLPVFLCFCVFHDAILGVFSRGYTAASAVLIIISLGNLVDAGVGSVGSLLAMTGHARVVLVNTVVTMMVNIGLSCLLVPRFNAIGAAIAAATAVTTYNVAGFIAVYCILKILLFRWDMLKSALAGGVASVVGILLLRIIHVGYGYTAILGTLSLVLPFMLVYAIMLALLRLSKEDMTVFDALFAKLGKKQLAVQKISKQSTR